MREVVCLALFFGSFVASGTTVSGIVVDAAGHPLPSVAVFLECGIAAPLVRTETDDEGRYALTAEGNETCGVFAFAPGKAFGGYTVRPTADVEGPPIVLGAPASIGGRVVNHAGRPVKGAQVASVVLLGDEQKVGIPLGKLRAYGVEQVVADDDGRFLLNSIPEGGRIALKVVHPLYAQRAVGDVAAGDTRVRIELTPGVIVQGTVLTRDERRPVARADVHIWSATPPHDTVLIRADAQGAFSVRLEPGVYRRRAFAHDYASPNWQGLIVAGDRPEQEMTVFVGRQAMISGSVRDAVSGAAVQGARLVLGSDGGTAAAATTGRDGAFSLEAVEGENILQIEAPSGYVPPELSAIRVTVSAGETLALPTFWLAPVSALRGGDDR